MSEERAEIQPITIKERLVMSGPITGLAFAGTQAIGAGSTAASLVIAAGVAAGTWYFSPELRDAYKAHIAPAMRGQKKFDWGAAFSKEYSPRKTEEIEEVGENEQEQEQRPETRVGHLSWDGKDDDLPAPVPPSTPKGPFLFSSILDQHRPTLDRIYLGNTAEGEPIFCTAEDLCHVALAGSTGGGKSSTMRMLMAQLCKAGASVLLLNPHHTRYDLKKQEDWTPFEPYLVYDPMETRKYETIEYYLKYVAETLLPKRLERYAHSLPLGRPYFIVLDELPAIIKRVQKAPEYLSEILREGRKVGIFLISASQDFLVKTLGFDGGGVRDCYRTAYYAGGDPTTARTLLDMPAKDIPENQLGKGTVMLRCAGSSIAKQAILAKVPYVDNAALYKLLGPSTYQPVSQSIQTEENLPEPTTRPEPVTKPAQLLRRIPPELQAAVNAYRRGMATYHDLARAMGCSPGDARIYWQEIKRRRLDRYGVSEPALQAQNEPVTRNDRNSEPETAPQAAVTSIYEPLPSGWTEDQVKMLPGFYKVFGSLDKSLEAVGLTTSQRNRDHGREILKQQGLREK